jgi:hypothetical protein
MTTITTTTAPRRFSLVTASVDVSLRGWINAAGFGSIVYYGMAFAMALVMPGATLLFGQGAALVLGVFAAGRLVGAKDWRSWLQATLWVIGAVALVSIAILAIFAVLAWGPLAP